MEVTRKFLVVVFVLCGSLTSLAGGTKRPLHHKSRITPKTTEVKHPPHPHMIKSYLTAMRGDANVIITCVCPEAHVFKWFFSKDGHSEQEVKRGVQSFVRYKSDLRLTSLSVSDAGTYVCRVTNSDGAAEVKAKLRVDDGPPRIVAAYRPPVRHGGYVMLRCDVIGFPNMVFTWFYLNATDPLKPLDHIQYHVTFQKSSTSLQLHSVDWQDEGIYRCVGTNAQKSVYADVRLRIVDVLTPVALDNSKTVVQGESVHFQCYFKSHAPVSYRWFHGNLGEITKQSKMEGGVSVLEVPKVTYLQHQGDFICQGSNNFSDETVKNRLQVLVPPTASVPTSYNASIGDTMFLYCAVNGVPAPSVDWLFEGTGSSTVHVLADNQVRQKHGSFTHFLKIAQVNRRHAGYFTCRARNEIGVAYASSHVMVVPV